jgi:hypothetical protein
MKERTGGPFVSESHGRRGLADPLCRKVMEEEEWWVLCVKKSWRIGLVDLLCRRVMEVDLLCRRAMDKKTSRSSA